MLREGEREREREREGERANVDAMLHGSCHIYKFVIQIRYATYTNSLCDK